MIDDKLIEILLKSKNVTVLTGAGVSQESGVSTFRDPDGLWSKFNPQELASMDGFLSNPQLVWDWYNYRRKIIYQVNPNPGHYALAELENIYPNFYLITQNVDRLHQRAGSSRVIELHGNIIDNYCKDCTKEFHFDEIIENIPKCDVCGGLIRPAVVWFGEMLPEKALKQSEILAMKSDVFISVGSSLEVYPAANLPIIAKNYGAVTIEINPNKSALSYYMDFILQYPSGIVLPKIVELIKEKLK
jgi:NAD-dependent deacetylase